MKKTGIFYGSTTGTCEELANQIAAKLGVDSADVHSVADLSADAIASYEALILGSSTWGDGELQDEWYDGVNVLKGANLAGKVVALFGCGDSSSYSATFCDAIGVIYKEIEGSGATFVGNAVDASDYTFDSSVSVKDGKFVGLALDEVNESNKTEARIAAWVEEVKKAL